jgi:hypothetical protein
MGRRKIGQRGRAPPRPGRRKRAPPREGRATQPARTSGGRSRRRPVRH